MPLPSLTRYLLALAAVVLAAGFFASSAQAGLVIQAPKYVGLDKGLVGFWSFDGKTVAGTHVYDQSGNGNRGTMTNGPTLAKGKLGQGMQFDGAEDYIFVNESDSLDATTGITISAWVYRHAASQWHTILAKRTSDTTNYAMRITNTNKVSFFFRDTGNSFDVWDTTATFPQTNTWQHMACTFSWGQTDAYCYVDGVAYGGSWTTGDGVGTPQTGTSGLVMGRRSTDETTEPLNGLLDDIRIYNRALSADEIKRLYKIGATAKLGISHTNDSLGSGLIGHWTFDGAALALGRAPDESGNGKEGRLSGGAAPAAGKIGQGVQFDGTDDYVSVGNAGSGVKTISFWVKANFGGAAATTESTPFPTTGTTTWQVPAGVTTMTAKVWGAGGGQGGAGGNNGSDGGGGYAKADISVTAGETLKIEVGAHGGGGPVASSGGGGGGFSGIWRDADATYLIIAGGGAGGGGGADANGERGGGGGGGGGADGANGERGTNATCGNGIGDNGDGATTAAAGAGGSGCSSGTDGAAGSGSTGGQGPGTSQNNSGTPGGGSGGSGIGGGGGGGGGGAFGGGSAERGINEGAGGGGGGSGKTTGLSNVTTAQGTSGSSFNAGAGAQDTDPDYANPAGDGGGGDQSSSAAGSNGNPGRVVISYTIGSTIVDDYKLIDIDGTDQIEIIDNIVTATSFPGATIYVDGQKGTTVDSRWHHVVITDTTGVNASAMDIGRVSSSYLSGLIDGVRLYNRELTQDEIKRLYKTGATVKIGISHANDSLGKGLVGWWTFDGKDMAGVHAYDASGNGNRGTLSSAMTATFGKIGQGVRTTNSVANTRVTVSNSSSINLNSTMTISFWVKSDATVDFGNMITKMNFGVVGWAIQNNSGANRKAITIRVDTSAGTNQSPCDIAPVTNGLDGIWHHIVFILDNGACWAYKDGALVSSGTYSVGTGFASAGSTLFLASGDPAPQGIYDDIRLYNRALSADEIKRLYNMGR